MLKVGSILGEKYKIVSTIGQGGLGVVYMATNEQANMIWAVKEVQKDKDHKLDIIGQCIVTEAKLLKTLRHRSIPSLIDVFDTDDSYIIVLDYIEGPTLQKILEAEGAQDPEKVIEWSIQLCNILEYLHSGHHPIIYRDMKPANIILQPNGTLALIDFSTAREYNENANEDTVYLGTPGYAAPEQFGGFGQTDPRTDIYALGATIFHLITGIRPKKDNNIDPISKHIPKLKHSKLETIIIKCCEKERNNRYQNCSELAIDLKQSQVELSSKKHIYKKKGLFKDSQSSIWGTKNKPEKNHNGNYYQVYLSYKRLDKFGNETPDTKLAEVLYIILTSKGVNVFFDKKTSNIEANNNENLISNAIKESKILVVIGTNHDYMDSQEVKKEYLIFKNKMVHAEDANDFAIFTYRGEKMPVDSLPKELQIYASTANVEDLQSMIMRRLTNIDPEDDTMILIKDKWYPSRLFKYYEYVLAECSKVANNSPFSKLSLNDCYIEPTIEVDGSILNVRNFLESWVYSKYKIAILCGESGVGKTSLCKKAVCDYYKNSWLADRVENVLFFSLIPDTTYFLTIDLYNPNSFLSWGDRRKEETIGEKYCKNALIFIDAYEELFSDIPSYSLIEFLSRIVVPFQKRTNAHIIVTCRNIPVQPNSNFYQLSDGMIIPVLKMQPITKWQQSEWIRLHIKQFCQGTSFTEEELVSYLDKVGNNSDLIDFRGMSMIDLFSHGKELLRAYYSETILVPVNECKVIFLGDAEAGKTHSINRLLNNGAYLTNLNGNATPGIEISVSSTILDHSNITINFWDFGGQEIQHSMHRMFLTERTLYVVFLNARQDPLDERARYWLENIKSFAPDAPILIAINKIDQNKSPKINEIGIKRDYDNQIKKIIKMSALTDAPDIFLEELQGSINEIIQEMSTIKKEIPMSWKSLMEDVRMMPEHYMTTSQFIKRCSFHNVHNYKDIHDELIDLFSIIGISFCYYKDRSIADYMLLNPKWLVNALYTIITNSNLIALNGVITQKNLYDLLYEDTINESQIKRVIPDLRYNGTEVNYIIGVTRMFRLSYPLKDGAEFFPMLCDGDEKISISEVVSENALHYFFRYKFLPSNVLHRLIVEMQRDLDYNNVWLTGAVFRNTIQGQVAYIQSEGNELHIYVEAKDSFYNPNEYLSPIIGSIREINCELGLSSEEFVTHQENNLMTEISFELIKGSISNGIYQYYDPKLKRVIDYRDIARRYTYKRPKMKKELLQDIIKALSAMQNDITFFRSSANSRDLENSRNRFISAQLRMAGYICCDQQSGGVSSSGILPGERDIVIEDTLQQDFLIYEGLNLKQKDNKYIKEHLEKLIKNYNSQGLNLGVLVIYLDCERDMFTAFIQEYRKIISEYAPSPYSCIGTPNNIDTSTNGQFLTCIEQCYKCGGLYFIIYHIVVRVAA